MHFLTSLLHAYNGNPDKIYSRANAVDQRKAIKLAKADVILFHFFFF